MNMSNKKILKISNG